MTYSAARRFVVEASRILKGLNDFEARAALAYLCAVEPLRALEAIRYAMDQRDTKGDGS